MVDARQYLQHLAHTLKGGREDICQFGHPSHDTIALNVHIPGTRARLNIDVYNWLRYETTEAGWCTGKDEVSKGIMHAGCWEAQETARVAELLYAPRPGDVVIDCGSHIGWYTYVAMLMGHDVLAIDASPEHLDTLFANVIRNFPNKPRPILCRSWIDDSSPFVDADGVRVRLLKLDIEGQEISALDVFDELFEQERIDAVLMEVTPPDDVAVRRLITHGFTGYPADKLEYNSLADMLAGGPADFDPNGGQANYLFLKNR